MRTGAFHPNTATSGILVHRRPSIAETPQSVEVYVSAFAAVVVRFERFAVLAERDFRPVEPEGAAVGKDSAAAEGLMSSL